MAVYYRPPTQTGGYSQFNPSGGYNNVFGGYGGGGGPAQPVGGVGTGGNLNSLLNYLLGSAVGGATGQPGMYGAPSSGLNPYHPSAFASEQAGMATQPGGQFNASAYNPYAPQIADLSKQFGTMSALPALDPASAAALAKIQQSQQANYNAQTGQMTEDLTNRIWAQGIPGSTGAQKLGTRLADQRSLGQAALDAASAQQQLGLRETLGQQQFQNLQAQLAALGQLNQYSAQGLQAQQQYQLQQQQFAQQQAAQRQQMLMSLMPMLMQMRAAQMQPSAGAPIPQAMSIPKPQPTQQSQLPSAQRPYQTQAQVSGYPPTTGWMPGSTPDTYTRMFGNDPHAWETYLMQNPQYGGSLDLASIAKALSTFNPKAFGPEIQAAIAQSQMPPAPYSPYGISGGGPGALMNTDTYQKVYGAGGVHP